MKNDSINKVIELLEAFKLEELVNNEHSSEASKLSDVINEINNVLTKKEVVAEPEYIRSGVITVDLRDDKNVLVDKLDGDFRCGIYLTHEGADPVLVLGILKVVMTDEQENKLRHFYENT